MTSTGKTDLIMLVAFWILPFLQVYKTCSMNWICLSPQVEIAMGILFYSRDNESHVCCPPEGGESYDHRVFVFETRRCKSSKGNSS